MNLSISKMVEQLTEAKKRYYYKIPTMSDEKFDKLEDELRERDPNNDYFKVVGTKPSGKKITHEIPMLSLNKCKTVEEVEKWFNKLGIPPASLVIVEPKIDGVSGELTYLNGALAKVCTRGDGLVGQDIYHVKDYVKGIPPKIISEGIIKVRGEFYLPKGNKLTDTKLRNICSGLINRKDDLKDLKHVRFIAYQLLGKKYLKESDKFVELEAMNFEIPQYQMCYIHQLGKCFQKYLDNLRESWNYETDGLVIVINELALHEKIDKLWVVEHHHHYNMALKPPSIGKETKLTDIEWNVSRQGNLIPVAIFEPIEINGVTIGRATLNNLENVINLKLRRGDRLFVERANDVIPFIAKNLDIRKTKELCGDMIPTKCYSCGAPLFKEKEGVHLSCPNGDCPERNIQQIIHYCTEADMEGIKEGTIRRLWKDDVIQYIDDLYRLREQDFSQLEGFGTKSVEKILKEIEKSKNVTFPKFVKRLGINLVGEKAVKKLGIASPEEFFNFNDSTYRIGQEIIEWTRVNIDIFSRLVCVMNFKEKGETKMKGKVCMTGKGPKKRDEFIADIESKGYEFSSSVTKDTNILICEDVEGGSGKLKKARENGTKLMSYEEFFS